MSKTRRARLKSFAVVLAAAALAAYAFGLCAAGARAQSGRRSQKTSTQPIPEATPQGESESKPRARSDKSKEAVVSFVVMEYNFPLTGITSMSVDDLAAIFAKRLGQPAAAAVTDGGKGGRQEARKRAKEETAAYVVLLQIEEDMTSAASRGGGYSQSLTLKTYTYAPKTGDLKYTDTIYQRPYYSTATVGGVSIPVPSRRIEQYPSQLQLEQASRDAADRLLSRFNITPPQN